MIVSSSVLDCTGVTVLGEPSTELLLEWSLSEQFPSAPSARSCSGNKLCAPSCTGSVSVPSKTGVLSSIACVSLDIDSIPVAESHVALVSDKKLSVFLSVFGLS